MRVPRIWVAVWPWAAGGLLVTVVAAGLYVLLTGAGDPTHLNTPGP